MPFLCFFSTGRGKPGAAGGQCDHNGGWGCGGIATQKQGFWGTSPRSSHGTARAPTLN